MKSLTPYLILCLLVLGLGVNAQNYESPNTVISDWYNALEETDATKRADMMKQLFIDNGTIHSVLQRSSLSSTLKGGSYNEFLKNSSDFYNTYTQGYDEVERSIDYYIDMAMVHSLVFQSIVEKSKPGVAYEQMLWYSLTMVYRNDRWYLVSVSWVNAFGDESIDDSMEIDTLWHRVKD